MAKKPVMPGKKPKAKPKDSKPSKAEKTARKTRLIAKGVDPKIAAFVTGENEDLTAEQIAERRIQWVRDLPKA